MLIDWRTRSVWVAAFAPYIISFESLGAGTPSTGSGGAVTDRRRRNLAVLLLLEKPLGM